MRAAAFLKSFPKNLAQYVPYPKKATKTAVKSGTKTVKIADAANTGHNFEVDWFLGYDLYKYDQPQAKDPVNWPQSIVVGLDIRGNWDFVPVTVVVVVGVSAGIGRAPLVELFFKVQAFFTAVHADSGGKITLVKFGVKGAGKAFG